MGSSHPEECTSNPIWKVIGYTPMQKEKSDTIITHPVWQVDIEVYRIHQGKIIDVFSSPELCIAMKFTNKFLFIFPITYKQGIWCFWHRA